MPKERGDTGRFVQTTTMEDVLDVFNQVRGPVITTGDVADSLDCSRETARRKLGKLYDQGRVDRRKRDTHVYYWYIDDGVSGQSNRPDRDVQDGDAPAGQPGQSPDDATDLEAGREADAGLSTRPDDVGGPIDLDTVIDDVATDTLPGSETKLEERTAALHAAVDYLRERGTATPADFRDDVYPDYDGQYVDGDDPALSWWKNCIYKGLRELSDRTDVVGKADTTGEWTYQGSGDR